MTIAQSTVFGEALAARLAPWMTDDLAIYVDGLGAMVDELYTLVYDQGVDGDPDFAAGYSQLFDVDACPTRWLPYLAQIVGVSIPAGSSDATARALIRAASGQTRGTVAAISAAVEASISTEWMPNTAYLIGVLVQHGTPPTTYIATAGFTSGATFATTHLAVIDITTQYNLIERFNGVTATANQAYQLTLVVRPEQLTPPSNSTALLAAVALNKPAGIILTTILSDSPVWADATLTWATTSGAPRWGTVTTGQV